jgi:hypothetical protein
MFQNHAFQVKMIKDKAAAPQDVEVTKVDPAEIAQIATEYTVKTIGAIGAVVAANRILKTICEIAVVTAKAKIK